MNFAALPVVNSWPSTPGLYFARMSCTGLMPARRRSWNLPAERRPPAGLAARRIVELAFGRILHPRRSRRPDPRLHVVHHLRIARADLGRVDPHVVVEMRVDQHVLLIDRAGGRNAPARAGTARRCRAFRWSSRRRSPPARACPFRIAFSRALFGPCGNGGNLVVASALWHS